MTFDLQLSLSDLLLMLPELWVTLWICVVLCVDFLMPRLSQRTIAGLSVAGMGVALLFLLGYYAGGTHGVLFGIFPGRMLSVIRSGVDPILARIMEVAPVVTQTGGGLVP